MSRAWEPSIYSLKVKQMLCMGSVDFFSSVIFSSSVVCLSPSYRCAKKCISAKLRRTKHQFFSMLSFFLLFIITIEINEGEEKHKWVSLANSVIEKWPYIDRAYIFFRFSVTLMVFSWLIYLIDECKYVRRTPRWRSCIECKKIYQLRRNDLTTDAYTYLNW